MYDTQQQQIIFNINLPNFVILFWFEEPKVKAFWYPYLDLDTPLQHFNLNIVCFPCF